MYPLKSKRPAAFSLIEILVVMAILVALAAFMLPHYLGGRTADGKKIKSPASRARDVVCMNNLSQIRMGITSLKSMDTDSNENGGFPKSLAELKFPAEMLRCPDGHEPYVYDPLSGQVHCVYPGHEKY